MLCIVYAIQQQLKCISFENGWKIWSKTIWEREKENKNIVIFEGVFKCTKHYSPWILVDLCHFRDQFFTFSNFEWRNQTNLPKHDGYGLRIHKVPGIEHLQNHQFEWFMIYVNCFTFSFNCFALYAHCTLHMHLASK